MQSEFFLFAILGLVFGSFGNVLIMRFENGESINGRSHCMSCKKSLGIVDLVPVFSYALLGGRCRHCGAHISLQYPVVELLSASVFLIAAAAFPASLLSAVLTAALLYFLLLSSVFDALHQKLPDTFTVTIACLAFVLTAFAGDIFSSLLGVLLCLAWFGGQWAFTKRKAVGTGDIFLSSALALWLGFRGTIAMLVMSYMAGAIIILLLLALGAITMKQKRIAFGPFLALGALLSFLGVQNLLMF